jgi:hypothetical protein
VTLAVVQEDTDLPVVVEASLSYGADLTGRLAQLVGPGEPGARVDWAVVSDRIGVEPPADYRWLIERYGAGPIGGYLTLVPPEQLPKPVPGPLVGLLSYMTPELLTRGDADRGGVTARITTAAW